MPRIIKCEICHDRQHRRLDSGVWVKCECLLEDECNAYLNGIQPRERWDKCDLLRGSALYESIRIGGTPGFYRVELDAGDLGFTAFHHHLKTVLRAGFLTRARKGIKPLKCKIIHTDDVTGIKYDKFKGHEFKKEELVSPDLLILMVPVWSKFEAFYNELESLISNRSLLGHSTWVVSNNYKALDEVMKCPSSFKHFLSKGIPIQLKRSEISSISKIKKEEKKTVLCKRMVGPSGLDTKIWWIPEDIRTKSLLKEIDNDESDGYDSQSQSQ